MTSNRAKGNNFQVQIVKYLEKQGWHCHNQVAMAKWLPFRQMWVSTRNDILGCIDVLAVRPDAPPLFIQATMHTGVGKKLADLRSVPWPYDRVDVQLWIKRGPRRVTIMAVHAKDEQILGELIAGKWHDKEEE